MSLFSTFTQPNYPSAAIGIGSSALTALVLSGGRKGYSVRQAGSLELPAGLVTPSFLEPNISDHIEFASCLREVAEISGLLKQKRWSIALPSSSARTAILTIDNEPASKQEAEEVLDWKAEQIFGAPAAELRIAKRKISPDRDGRTRYFASAVRLQIIDEFETHFESLGWRAGLILPRSVGEANWLVNAANDGDSLLISGNVDGFTALLLRGSEPAVVRSVTCKESEVDDEVYRLVMFYGDRYGAGESSLLEKLLVVGRGLVPARIQTIASEALGRSVTVLTPNDLRLTLPDGGLRFDDIAAPAGLAVLGT